MTAAATRIGIVSTLNAVSTLPFGRSSPRRNAHLLCVTGGVCADGLASMSDLLSNRKAPSRSSRHRELRSLLLGAGATQRQQHRRPRDKHEGHRGQKVARRFRDGCRTEVHAESQLLKGHARDVQPAGPADFVLAVNGRQGGGGGVGGGL